MVPRVFDRNQHLERMGQLLSKRQALNLETIKILLPEDRGGIAPNLAEGVRNYGNYIFDSVKHLLYPSQEAAAAGVKHVLWT